MPNKNFRTLLIFFTAYLLFISFGRTILPTHVLSQGLTISQQVFSMGLAFLGQGILLLFFRKYSSKLAWSIAIILAFLYIGLSIKLLNVYQFYIASFLNGIGLALFFIPYNIAHFTHTVSKDIGKSSAFMFSIFPAASIIAPLMAGFLAEINKLLVWVMTAMLFSVVTFFLKKQEAFQVKYSVPDSLKEIKATRIFIFIEGIWEALVLTIIPIYTLHFIQTPGYYGLFIAYLSAAGLLANLMLGRVTDKIQKRAIFLFPLTISLATITFLFPFATKDLFLWTVVASLIQFLLPLFWNISTAMVVDTHPNLGLAIPGREIMLMSGRILGVFLVSVSFFIEKAPFYIFFILGGVMLIYPLVLFWNTKISKQYKYL